MKPPLLNSKTVCQWLGIAPATLSRMVHSKKIPFILLTTGKRKMVVRFEEAALQAWLDRWSRGPAPPKAKENAPHSTHSLEVSKGDFLP